VATTLDWADFARRAKDEAAFRNRRFLVLGAAMVVAFTLFDVSVEHLSGRVLWTRLLLNATVLLTLFALAFALGKVKVRQHVFAILFALCAVVLAMQGYSLGVLSPAPGRLGLHFSVVMGLTMIGVQWFWPWQLALGTLAVALFASTVPADHPDFSFYLVALTAAALLTSMFARTLIQWRYTQYATEAELRRANEVMSMQTAQLEAKNAELTDFLFILSHDLRAPLINLQGFSNELERSISALEQSLIGPQGGPSGRTAVRHDGAVRQIRAEIDESLEFIRRAVGKMSTLVNGILELSRIDSRPQVRQQVELGPVVGEILSLFRYQITARGIEIEVDPLPEVIGDPLRLGQVFGNLIDNAIKYMKPAGEARIELRHTSRNGDHVFSIRDTGVGIRDVDQKKVFRLFTRLGASGPTGDGVGLAAVKRIVEKHGGTIWVESQLGIGSTFSFSLPRAEDDGG
jgi:signal transduction histidine kinase